MKETIYSKITKHDAFIPFDQSMMPNKISPKEIVSYFEFMSPLMLILHGSYVSKKRYSPSGESDLDIVCISVKAAFWPLNQLYNQFYKNIKNADVKIDLTILTYIGFLSILEGNTSLSISLNKGFTILYAEN